LYTHPKANASRVNKDLSLRVEQIQTDKPDGVIIICGDFNHCRLKIPKFYQQVTVATRKEKTIDLAYVNVKEAYTSIQKPSLGKSDHISVLLLPKYKQQLKSQPVQKKTVKVWNRENIEKLQGCFDCTNWEVFEEEDVNRMTDVVTSYINFCEDLCISEKTVTVYPNQKPWVTKEFKDILKQKHSDPEGKKNIKKLSEKCRKKYKERVEEKLVNGDIKGVWDGVREITGTKKKKTTTTADGDPVQLANDLNVFYARFDKPDSRLQGVLEELEKVEQTGDSVRVSEDEVKTVFSKLKPGKACGPDGIKPRLLKVCAEQLAAVFQAIFNKSLLLGKVPVQWKLSKIVPVPKKAACKEFNDFRPIALTPVVMKCLEKLVLKRLLQQTEDQLDPLQFAYRARRGTDDATILIIHSILEHLEKPNTSARVLYIDFSSAFNTVRPSLMYDKLVGMSVAPQIIKWVVDFLVERTQYVTVDGVRSGTLEISTGSPQGCCLSPTLFTLYTNDFNASSDNNKLVKFADDSALLGLVQNDDDSEYKKDVAHIVEWCEENSLDLNVDKTKEMLCDFRKNKVSPEPVVINEKQVERVQDYKYLGTIISANLTWSSHVEKVVSKCHSRLYFLRKLRQFKVSKEVLMMFYRASIESVMTFNFTTWLFACSAEDRYKLDRVIKQAEKIIGTQLPSLDDLIKSRTIRKVHRTMADESHPLCSQFQLLPSRRRLRVAKSRTERMRKSFVPSAITVLNSIY
jgi:hypothetical protein